MIMLGKCIPEKNTTDFFLKKSNKWLLDSLKIICAELYPANHVRVAKVCCQLHCPKQSQYHLMSFLLFIIFHLLEYLYHDIQSGIASLPGNLQMMVTSLKDTSAISSHTQLFCVKKATKQSYFSLYMFLGDANVTEHVQHYLFS